MSEEEEDDEKKPRSGGGGLRPVASRTASHTASRTMVAASLEPARSVQAPTRASTEMVPGEAEEEGDEGSSEGPVKVFFFFFKFEREKKVSLFFLASSSSRFLL